MITVEQIQKIIRSNLIIQDLDNLIMSYMDTNYINIYDKWSKMARSYFSICVLKELLEFSNRTGKKWFLLSFKIRKNSRYYSEKNHNKKEYILRSLYLQHIQKLKKKRKIYKIYNCEINYCIFFINFNTFLSNEIKYSSCKNKKWIKAYVDWYAMLRKMNIC